MTDEPIDQIAPGPEEPVLEDVEAVPEDAEAVEACRLILIRSGKETDVVYEVSSPSVVGRFDPAVGPIDIDLSLIDEGVYISRKHAKLTYEDGKWKVADLGSSNGTFLLRGDFERVDEAELEDGATLAFGNARFLFRTGAQTM